MFYKLLNTVGDLLAQDQVSEVEELLLNLLQHPLPGTQASVELVSGVTISRAHGIPPPAPGNSRPLSCFVAPDPGRLPSIPENVSGHLGGGSGGARSRNPQGPPDPVVPRA